VASGDKPEWLPVDGDLRAFFESSLREVYTYLYHRCGGDRALAEDLTQEAFLGAVRHCREGRVGHLTTAWLMSVAKSRLIDHYRHMAREERKLKLAWTEPDGEAPYDASVWSQERTLRALDAVPALQRAALVLHYLDRLPVDRVALELAKSVHATESLLARGRSNFRRHYLEEEQ
jgi:RNA polymerase sigma-70 factor (ECF subfamily)